MAHQSTNFKPVARDLHSFLSNPLIVACLTIVLLLAGLEWAARQPWFDRLFPYQSHGMNNVLFDIKWQKLEQYVEINGGVDVIFFGHSLANTGIDPSEIRRQIKLKTGQDLRIFNFGVEGVPLSGNAYVVKLIAETYHPAVIVFISEIRDFRSGIGDDVTSGLLANPWFQYQMGQKNILGWLIEHSDLVRHYLAYQDWMMSGPYTTLNQFSDRAEIMHADGYEPDHGISQDAATPLDPNIEKDAFMINLLATYSIDTDREQSLQYLLQAASVAGGQALVIEWPFPDSVFNTPGGNEAYQLYSEELDSIVAGNDALRLPGMSGEVVFQKGRSDRYHLNISGAYQFSDYLARVLISQRIVDQILSRQDLVRP